MDELNVTAAQWWARQLELPHKRQAFERELLARLPAGDWQTYVDYDPDALLISALNAAGIHCSGFAFSAEGIFPFTKTGLRRENGQLFVKQGYGAPSVPLTDAKEGGSRATE